MPSTIAGSPERHEESPIKVYIPFTQGSVEHENLDRLGSCLCQFLNRIQLERVDPVWLSFVVLRRAEWSIASFHLVRRQPVDSLCRGRYSDGGQRTVHGAEVALEGSE